jgi:hypothetical protein
LEGVRLAIELSEDKDMFMTAVGASLTRRYERLARCYGIGIIQDSVATIGASDITRRISRRAAAIDAAFAAL